MIKPILTTLIYTTTIAIVCAFLADVAIDNINTYQHTQQTMLESLGE